MWIITQGSVNPSGSFLRKQICTVAASDLGRKMSVVALRAVVRAVVFKISGVAVRTARLGGHDTHISVTKDEVLR